MTTLTDAPPLVYVRCCRKLVPAELTVSEIVREGGYVAVVYNHALHRCPNWRNR